MTSPYYGLEGNALSGIPSPLSLDFVALGLWVVGALAVFTGGFMVLRLLRGFFHRRRSRFHTVTLLVTVPKFHSSEESKADATKERVQQAIAAAETLFSTIGGVKGQHGVGPWLFGRTDEMAFEIVCLHKVIRFYVTVPRALQAFAEQTFSSSWSDVNIEAVEDYNIFSPTGVVLGSYLKLKRLNAFPIKTYRALDKDPLDALTNALAKIPENEGAAFQFIVRPVLSGWRKSGMKIARNMKHGMTMEEAISGHKKSKAGLAELSGWKQTQEQQEHRLSPLDERAMQGLEEKASKAGMEVCIRLVACGASAQSAEPMLNNMLNAFGQYSMYEYGNSFLKALPGSKNTLVSAFVHREFEERASCVLNAEELASVWHVPTPWSETPNIQWLLARRGPAPAHTPGPEDGDIELGYNIFRGVKTPVWIKKADRQRHMYIMGKSGAGKSELIAKLAVQDIRKGRGVAVIDPHGDLVDQILAHVPPERVDDVIYFCPADTERPLGLNMLEARDESQKDMAAQEMVAMFYKMFGAEMIGPMFEHTMRNVMLTLMADAEHPGTIAEIPRMLTDDAFANEWVAKLKDPVVRAFWEKEMAKTSDNQKSEMLGYLISKVGRFVENEMMRNIIGQSHSSFDFRRVMDEQKILLVNLSKGRTGDVNAELLGLIMVSKLQMAALGRADMPEQDRKDFYLYIDEFQNFITDSIATILSEARKYRLCLIIAHQYIGQLVKNNDTKIKDAVFGNVGTVMVGRIGPEDVDVFEKIYAPTFGGYDLMNSDRATWYTKMIIDNAQQKPFTLTFDMIGKGDAAFAENLKQLSRLRYGRDRELVEAEILERSQLDGGERGTATLSEAHP